MSENGAPKLYFHKPKKGQLKQARGNASKDFFPQQVYTPPPPPPPPSSSSAPPTSAPAKESFFRRYKYLWPLLITVNLAYGASLYQRIKKQRASEEEETAAAIESVSTTSHPLIEISSPSSIAGEPSTQASATAEPQNFRSNLSDEQKCDLF